MGGQLRPVPQIRDNRRMTWGSTVISGALKPSCKRPHDGRELSVLTGFSEAKSSANDDCPPGGYGLPPARRIMAAMAS